MNEEDTNKTARETPDVAPLLVPPPEESKIKGWMTQTGKLFTDIVYELGFGKAKAKDQKKYADATSTFLAHQRTDLAMERSYLAAERTLMAWIRTSLSMISFGFTIGKLGQALEEIQVKGLIGVLRSTVSVEAIAQFLVILGIAALIGSAFQYRIRVRELYTLGLEHQFSIAFIISVLLALLGFFALTSLVLAL